MKWKVWAMGFAVLLFLPQPGTSQEPQLVRLDSGEGVAALVTGIQGEVVALKLQEPITGSTPNLTPGAYLAFLGKDTEFAVDPAKLRTEPTLVCPVEVVRVKSAIATARIPKRAIAGLKEGWSAALFPIADGVDAIPVATIGRSVRQVHFCCRL